MSQFLRASGLILLSGIGLYTLGFQRTLSRIEAARRGRPRPAADCVLAVKRARAYGIYRGNCLSQSMALLWLLRRAGHAGQIKIGVKSVAGRPLAHAWVELEGETIDPAAIAGEYAALRPS